MPCRWFLALYFFLSPGHSFHPAFILIFSESHLSPSLSSPGQGRREEEPREGGRPGLMRDERSGPVLRSGGRPGPGQEVGQARVAPAWRRGAASAERPGGTARRGLGREAWRRGAAAPARRRSRPRPGARRGLRREVWKHGAAAPARRRSRPWPRGLEAWRDAAAPARRCGWPPSLVRQDCEEFCLKIF